MKRKILIILIVLISLGLGGFFVYKSILQPEPEKKGGISVVEEKSEEKETKT